MTTGQNANCQFNQKIVNSAYLKRVYNTHLFIFIYDKMQKVDYVEYASQFSATKNAI